MDEIFRAAGHFLTYQGIDLRRHEVRDLYLEIMKRQQQDSAEDHPEFDAVAIWRTIISEYQTDYTRRLPADKLAQLPLFLAELYRGVSRRRLRLYPHVRRCSTCCAPASRWPWSPTGKARTPGPSCTRSACSATSTRSSCPVITGTASPTGASSRPPRPACRSPPSTSCTWATTCTATSTGPRQAGMATVLFDSDQGTKDYPGCVPDHTLTDHRQLLTILGLDLPPATSPRPSALPADTHVVADAVASQGGRAAGTGACGLPERRTCR